MYEVTTIAERASPLEAIGILIVFTMVFGFAMWLLTTAKRQELFTACAAYCAVLVVFIGNVSQQATQACRP